MKKQKKNKKSGRFSQSPSFFYSVDDTKLHQNAVLDVAVETCVSKMSKINLRVGEKLFSLFFNKNGRNSKYEFGQWKYLRNWVFYAFKPFFKFQQFPRYTAFYVILKTFFEFQN